MLARGVVIPPGLRNQTQSVWFLLLALSRNGRRMLLKRQACVVGSNAR